MINLLHSLGMSILVTSTIAIFAGLFGFVETKPACQMGLAAGAAFFFGKYFLDYSSSKFRQKLKDDELKSQKSIEESFRENPNVSLRGEIFVIVLFAFGGIIFIGGAIMTSEDVPNSTINGLHFCRWGTGIGFLTLALFHYSKYRFRKKLLDDLKQ